jgi:hypothetical protein
MFLGLLDPDTFVRAGIDLDLDPSNQAKIGSKLTLDSYCFVTSFLTFYLRKML